jgi:hypothetical protein
MDCTNEQDQKRYSLAMRLRYRVKEDTRTTWRGIGYTVDLSRSVIRFRASRALPENSQVDLVLDWPVRFADMYPMELTVSGSVGRSTENETEVNMSSWQFRIAPGARAFDTDRAQGWVPRSRPNEEAPIASSAVM